MVAVIFYRSLLIIKNILLLAFTVNTLDNDEERTEKADMIDPAELVDSVD